MSTSHHPQPPPKQPSFQKNHLSGGLDAETYQSRCCDSWVKHASKSQKYSTNHPRLTPCSARFPSPPGSPPKHRFNAEDKWASGLSHKQSMCSTGDPPFIAHKGPPTAVLIFRGWNQWGKKVLYLKTTACHRVELGIPLKDEWILRVNGPGNNHHLQRAEPHPLLPAAAACEEAIMISPSPQAQLS